MKKILSIIAVAVLFISTTFAFELNFGIRGMVGGNVGNVNKDYDGFVCGSGLYGNLNFYNGFGAQIEANFVSNTITANNNSVTFKACEIVDIPVMFWYNNKMDNITVGGGLGINFSTYSDKYYRTSNDSTVNLGFAMGLNFKYHFTSMFGLVLGTNAVFDFMPTQKISNGDEITYIFGSGNTRKAIYGNLGLEIKLF